MNNRLKYPLSLFVVWHPAFNEGKNIANNLYSIFCRDTEQPLSRGLGVPVHYRSISKEVKPIPIDTSGATKNAIVLLIDQNYFTDENFGEYTKSLLDLIDDNTRIYPVALCDEAYNQDGLSSFQFTRAFQGDLKNKDDFDYALKKIKTELLHNCARLMVKFQPTSEDKDEDRKNSPVKLFLSHAKKDGLETTKRFKAFIDSELKLDVFFDTLDIADGYEFEKQIEVNIKSAALVVFHTDEYSAREWCRIEVLTAKRNKCSIVVVNDIKNGEKRAFPYMGNTPTITLQTAEEEQNFIDIVNLTLYQVINNLFQKELLESFRPQIDTDAVEPIILTSPPELFNYIDIYKKKEADGKPVIVLYPEPPLGTEELKVLNEIDENIKFITPISLPTFI